MIVVRRYTLNRSPQYSSPMPKMMPMIRAATEIWTAVNPCELEDRLAEPQADRRVDRDPGGREEPHVRAAQELQVAAEADVWGLDRGRLAGRILDRPEDQ
jgi:hypothetical protein